MSDIPRRTFLSMGLASAAMPLLTEPGQANTPRRAGVGQQALHQLVRRPLMVRAFRFDERNGARQNGPFAGAHAADQGVEIDGSR